MKKFTAVFCFFLLIISPFSALAGNTETDGDATPAPATEALPLWCRFNFSVTEQTMIITSPCRAADIDGADILKTGSGETAKPDAALYTGMTLFAYKTETYGTAFLGKYTIVIMGDVNCDGEVKANDARLVLRAAARLEKLGEYRSLAADFDNNTKITAADARMILRRSAGL